MYLSEGWGEEAEELILRTAILDEKGFGAKKAIGLYFAALSWLGGLWIGQAAMGTPHECMPDGERVMNL